MLPSISIVTPSFQHGRFLEWTIRSVMLQDFPKLEYVVMDGGSTDQTAEILARYRRFFTHVESAKDGGQADAVARGFAHTSGEIMAYLNSDDMLAPGALEFVAPDFSRGIPTWTRCTAIASSSTKTIVWSPTGCCPPHSRLAHETLGLHPSGDLFLAAAHL